MLQKSFFVIISQYSGLDFYEFNFLGVGPREYPVFEPATTFVFILCINIPVYKLSYAIKPKKANQIEVILS